jgi:GTP 3',8-cyclase
MFGRQVGDLRISVTDRCNFRCTYCIQEDYNDWLPKDCILSYEELARLVRILNRFGIHTVRLTGGEPLMRRELQGCAELSGVQGGTVLEKHVRVGFCKVDEQ